MKCPFCGSYRDIYDSECKHCKMPFIELHSHYYGNDFEMDLMNLSGDEAILKRLSDGEKRFVDLNRTASNKLSWFQKLLGL